MYDRETYISGEPLLKRQLFKLFKRNQELIIFDIGACEGEDSIRYSKLFPNARFFCFEPLPKNQNHIKSNIHKYKATNIELVPYALSDKNGIADFYVSSENNLKSKNTSNHDWDIGNKSSSLLEPDRHHEIAPFIEFKEMIKVNTMRLDTFLDSKSLSNIDFIHMDVQGAELMVLSGAGKSMESIKSIWLEVANIHLYKAQPLVNDIYEFMKSHGFVLVKNSIHGNCGDQFYINSKYFPLRSFFYYLMNMISL